MTENKIQRWYVVSEDMYDCFCRSENVLDRWKLLSRSSEIKNLYCESQLKVIDELIYRALFYCCEVRLDFQSMDILLMLLQKELLYLARTRMPESTEQLTPIQRFQDLINELRFSSAAPLVADSVRKMLSFMTENLFKYSAAYSFVLEAYPDERDYLITLDVSTPVTTVVPLRLAERDHPNLPSS